MLLIKLCQQNIKIDVVIERYLHIGTSSINQALHVPVLLIQTWNVGSYLTELG